jgi:hypothetical protein
MPKPGHFILHSRAVPPLVAGNYTFEAEQEVAGGPTEPYTGHVRITSPRFGLPPDQILSTFPPANAEGAFEARLPQIVLRRRTLPWERQVDPASRATPWLALVVIAEGEGQLSGETPVRDCITPGVTLTGPNDVATGVYLGVSETVVKKIFPAKEDLQLLAHVREVDLGDTELAVGDDDGFLAVVLANRLPQFDRVNCKPVRYMACLINLEGQFADLPDQDDFATPTFDHSVVVQDVRVLAASRQLVPDKFVMGTGVAPDAVNRLEGFNDVAEQSVGHSDALGPKVQGSVKAGAPLTSIAQSWQTTQANVSQLAVSAAPEEAGRLVRDAMSAGFRLPVEWYVAERTFRFPVLAHWSFTCTGAGSFETLMQGLDVGLLGTMPADPFAKPRPDCLPPPGGTAPPPTDPPRPAPELTETGHISLSHLTRRGDALRAWYRGPFTLHVTERAQPDADGHLPLAHTSDQLRRVVPDGREDLSLAAAFEIGRLLALSQPSVVAALIRWRREQFGAERARRLSRLALTDTVVFDRVAVGTIADIGMLAGKQFILEAAKDPDAVLAPARPLADPGRPLTYLDGDLDEIVAAGFGIPLERVRDLASRVGVVSALNSVAVPEAGARRFGRADAEALRRGLAGAVDEITAGVLATRVVQPVRGGLAEVLTPRAAALAGETEGRDALDELLDAASRTKGESS